MNGIDFDEMKEVDVRTVDRATLKDINDVVVDTALPKEERLRSFIEQIGNPYCYKCGVCKNGKTYFYYMCGKNRTTKKCTSHRISDGAITDGVLVALRQHIANIVEMERILKYIDTLPYKSTNVKKLNSQIINKEDEVKRYEQLKTALFENLSDGILDKNEYLRLKSVYDEKQEFAECAITNLKQEIDKLVQNRTEETLWIEKFKLYQNIDTIDRKIAVNLIDKITVYDDKSVLVKQNCNTTV